MLPIRHLSVAHFTIFTQTGKYTGWQQTAASNAWSAIDRKLAIYDELGCGPWRPQGDIR